MQDDARTLRRARPPSFDPFDPTPKETCEELLDGARWRCKILRLLGVLVALMEDR